MVVNTIGHERSPSREVIQLDSRLQSIVLPGGLKVNYNGDRSEARKTCDYNNLGGRLMNIFL